MGREHAEQLTLDIRPIGKRPEKVEDRACASSTRLGPTKRMAVMMRLSEHEADAGLVDAAFGHIGVMSS